MGSFEPSLSFSSPPSSHLFSALLFDFDGTLVDSTSAIVKHWHYVAAELGLDPVAILATSHGRRSIDTLRVLKPEKANWDYVSQIEGRIPATWGQDAIATPGAREVLEQMEREDVPWAVVTSGTRALINGWIKIMGLQEPKTMVVAEDVEIGKPDPTCYLMGARKLGLDVKQSHGEEMGEVLVVEDAPSGVRAGKAAGFKVLALATTHDVQSVRDAGADWVIRDLRSFKIIGMEKGKARIEILDALI